MLQQVRSALKGVIAWFVIVLLVLAFALWGVPELRNFAQQAPLRVGEAGFSQQAIINEFNRQVAARRNQTGDYTREQAIADGVPDFVVNSLVARSVLEQEAEKIGLAMPRALVRDYLQSEEGFKNPLTGEVDELALQRIAQANNISISQLEATIREDLLRNQLIQAVGSGGPAAAPLTEPLLLRDTELRRVAYLVVTDELAGVPAEPTPDALRAYYDENPAPFTAPEFRTFTYVPLREDQFREDLEASEEDLRALYETRKSRDFEKPETRTLYQITYDNEAQAQAAAAALREGRPVEQVARERGLSLGAVTFPDVTRKDILDPAVGAAAFEEGLEAGSVVGPVKSVFGWTVAQVASINAATVTPFEEVREELEAQTFEQDTRRRVFDAVEAIEDARDTGAGLAAAAEQAGVPAQTVGPVDSMSFAPGGAIIAEIPGEAIDAAFRLDEGEESEALELADKSGYFFVQVEEIIPPAVKPYEEVADQVARLWREDERRKRIADTVEAIRTEIADGKSLEEAASAFNRAPLTETLSRDVASETFSRPVVQDVFLADQGALVTGDAGFGAAQVIAEVREIGFSRNRVGPDQEQMFSQYVGYQLDQELLDAYIAALREDYEVRADPAAIAQIFSEEQ